MICTQNTMHMTCQAFMHDDFQAWCEMGRASTPASDTVGELEGDDWLGSSSHVGPSEGTGPIHPSRTFQQNLRSVQELSEDIASASGEHSFCAHCVCSPKFPAFHREAGSAFCRKRHKRHLLNSWLVAERFCHAA